MSFLTEKPFGIVYNYPVEYNAIAAELWRRDVPLSLINPTHLHFDPSVSEPYFSLVFNDLSRAPGFPADDRFISSLILYIRHLESGQYRLAQGRIINGSGALETFANRVRQISLFASAGVRYPRTTFANSLEALIRESGSLKFPILIKPNRSSSPILKFTNSTQFVEAVFDGTLSFNDELVLAQDYLEPNGDHIGRIDLLNGKFLAARKVFTLRDPMLSWEVELKTEHFEPGLEIIRSAEHIARAGKLDLASIEYFTDRRSGEPVFYNIAPLQYSRIQDSDGKILTEIGDYFERRLRKIREIELAI
jgi:hypothetical protein